jgi:hypothetical protein
MRPIFFAILLTLVSTPAFAATTWSSLDSQGFVRKAVCTTGTEAAPTLATEGLSAASLASVVVVVESGSAFGAGARLNAYTWNQFSAAWSRQPEADIELDATLKAQTIGPLNPGPVGRLVYAPSGLAAASTIILIGSPSAEGVRPQALDAYGRVYVRSVSADGDIPEVTLGGKLGTETNRLATTATATAGGLTGAVTVPDSTDVPVPATALENRRGVTVQNLGPSAIYCCLQTGCTTATGMRVLPGGSMYRGVGPSVGIFCISASGDADVRVEEVR